VFPDVVDFRNSFSDAFTFIRILMAAKLCFPAAAHTIVKRNVLLNC